MLINNMRRLGISEILIKASSAKTREERVAIIRQNDSNVLRGFLKLYFTPGVRWLLPEGHPPHRFNDMPGQEGNLYAEWKRFYLFFPGGNNNLDQRKREMIFIQILESIDPKDADLVCFIKDGIMPYDNLPYDVIDDAFPGLVPSQRKKTLMLDDKEIELDPKVKRAKLLAELAALDAQEIVDTKPENLDKESEKVTTSKASKTANSNQLKGVEFTEKMRLAREAKKKKLETESKGN